MTDDPYKIVADKLGDLQKDIDAQMLAAAQGRPSVASLINTPYGIPDRLSVIEGDNYHNAGFPADRLNVIFNGEQRPGDVLEYCISERWVRVWIGKKRSRGKPLAQKMHGLVQVIWK